MLKIHLFKIKTIPESPDVMGKMTSLVRWRELIRRVGWKEEWRGTGHESTLRVLVSAVGRVGLILAPKKQISCSGGVRKTRR